MNKKIIGICVCMLLRTSPITVNTIYSNNTSLADKKRKTICNLIKHLRENNVEYYSIYPHDFIPY